MGDARHQRLSGFSKGMKQKVVLAAALIHRPQVLILDEPLDGLDANTARVVRNCCARSRRKAARSCSVPIF